MSSTEWTDMHTLFLGLCLIVFSQPIVRMIIGVWATVNRSSLERFEAYLRRRK